MHRLLDDLDMNGAQGTGYPSHDLGLSGEGLLQHRIDRSPD